MCELFSCYRKCIYCSLSVRASKSWKVSGTALKYINSILFYHILIIKNIQMSSENLLYPTIQIATMRL